MALRRLALGTILAAFPGRAAPGWALELLADGLAGFTLFGGNIGTPDELTALTAELRTTRPDALLATDEEGGDVTRLAHRTGSPYPGNAALGVADDPELTRAVYAAIGAELSAAGVNLNLAPVVDVNTSDDNPVIGTRSFGADPLLVARHARAAVAGLRASGVAACAKHFPGHGATHTDSHLALPTVDAPLDVLRTRDLPPFVAADAPAIMTAHLRVPALTGDEPATFSRRALQGLLRDELGFGGVIVTDALEMRGVGVDVPEAAVRALAAGADLLCLGARVGRELTEAVTAAIEAAVREGRLPVARLAEAAARNAALAAGTRTPQPVADLAGSGAARESAAGPASSWATSGAAAGPASSWTASGAAAGPANSWTASAAPGGPAGDLGLVAARRAVRVEGSPLGFTSALVVRLGSAPSIAEGRVPWGLGPHLGAAEQVEVVAAEASPEALLARAGSRPILVVGRRIHRSPAARALVERLAAGHAVGVVEMGWPSGWRPAHARAFVTTHGASLANGQAAAEVLGLR